MYVGDFNVFCSFIFVIVGAFFNIRNSDSLNQTFVRSIKSIFLGILG